MTSPRDLITDARLRFYLERRDLIDEWARLRELEHDEANRFLLSLEEDLQALAAEYGDMTAQYVPVGGEAMIALARPTWGWDEERPAVCVQLAWYPRSIRFASPRNPPWVGLRARRSEGFESLRQALGKALTDTGVGKEEFPKGSPLGKNVWPRYRELPCEYENYWDDLSPYRSSLVQAAREACDLFIPIVDRVVAAWSGGASARS